MPKYDDQQVAAHVSHVGMSSVLFFCLVLLIGDQRNDRTFDLNVPTLEIASDAPLHLFLLLGKAGPGEKCLNSTEPGDFFLTGPGDFFFQYFILFKGAPEKKR